MGKKGESSCGSGHYCGSGKIDSAPAGAVTAGAVGTYEKNPVRAGTTAVVGKIERRFLLEQALLR